MAVKGCAHNGYPDWFGVVEWELNGTVEVSFPDDDMKEYSIGELRPLTKRERGQ